DSANSEVPYLVTEERPVYRQHFFKEYEIQSRKITPGKSTVVRLHNAEGTPISNISLVVKNADAQKKASLTGSDDGEQWFVVRENFTLYPVRNTDAVAEVRAIEFPLTNYRFYRLAISDSASAPFNILKAGYYDQAVTHGRFTRVPDSVSVSTHAQEKRTYITLKFAQEQLVDKIELRMTGTAFFQRHGYVTTDHIRTVKKREERYTERLENFTVRTGQTTVITFTGLKTNNLTLCIDNGDNPALSIDELETYQLNRYLTAWLTKGQAYTVGFTGKDTSPPRYDLAYFRDSIPANAQVLKINDLQPIVTEPVSGDPTFFTSKTIIWIAIGAVIILLGFMSLRLVKETNAADDNT
ncbi:MAG TPA: hypothetical protein VFM90_03690, partial [Cyclobacteriaceae bacterium]|nr:hypothetical protein [Cyclobacteriaceae bacterium]